MFLLFHVYALAVLHSSSSSSISLFACTGDNENRAQHSIRKKNLKHCAKARKHRATVRFSSQMLPNMRSTKNMKI